MSLCAALNPPLHPESKPAYFFFFFPALRGVSSAAWATLTMTSAHLVLALGLTVYILIAIYFEERDLIAHFGERYRTYRKQVLLFIPRPGKKVASEKVA